MTKKKRHFGLFVYLGIELRNFVFSSLSERLSEFADVSIISHQQADEFEELVASKNLKLIKIPYRNVLDKSRGKIEGYFLSVRRARLRLKGRVVFNLWHNTIPKRVKDYFIGNSVVYLLYQIASTFEIRKRYYNEILADLILQNKITDIILQSYFSIENMTLAITAQKLGCRIWVVNWSWKDLYINEYIPFNPDGFFTWSERLKELYQSSNRHINAARIMAIGNISYDRMINYQPSRDRSYYATKYSFDIGKPIVLYTMVHPRIFPDEQLIALRIAQCLEDQNLNFVILMKPNPMDTNWERFKSVERHGTLVTLENLWFYDKASDFNMITDEGQTEWLDLIYYSVANISVASTVTIEYLVMNKPVINILYTNDDNRHPEFVRLFNSPFYGTLHNRKDVIGCYTVTDVIDVLKDVHSLSGKNESLDDIIISNGQSLERFVNQVKEA
jgi:hypothetical protein